MKRFTAVKLGPATQGVKGKPVVGTSREGHSGDLRKISAAHPLTEPLPRV